MPFNLLVITSHKIYILPYRREGRLIFRYFLIKQGDCDEAFSALPAIKRRNGCSQIPEQSKDEQAISESSLNKLVGAAELYDLEV